MTADTQKDLGMAVDGVAPLLVAKSRVPTLRGGAVARPRLMAALDDAATSVTIVVAPAGWGKSTLLAQWALAQDHVVGWLTLDAGDDDPHRFWTYVVAALKRAGSSIGDAAVAALKVPGLDPLEVAIPSLLNDLADAGQPHAIVLDDFHLVADRRIAEAVEFFVTYLPPDARLVIGSRLDPPLPLALWRGRGLLTEVRADQLRFEVDEAVRLVESRTSVRLGTDQGAGLVERTGGWAAGLQLTVAAVRNAPDPADQLRWMAADHPHLVDYVSSEVLSGLDANHRDLLFRSSVLDRLCGPLCDAALDMEGSTTMLDRLASADPFVTRLDGGWFRCHSIVRDALRRQFVLEDEAGAREVSRRAARWCLAQAEPEQAIRHFIQAEDVDDAVALLLRYEDDFLDQGAIGAFLTMAGALGHAAFEVDRRLGVAMAWAAGVSGRRERVAELLDRAEAALDGTEPPPRGWSSLEASIAALRAIHGYQSSADLATAHAHAVRAAEIEQDPTLPAYAVTRLALGLALMGLDRLEEALPHLNRAWVGSDVTDMPVFARLPIAGLLAVCLISLGKTEDARTILATVAPPANRLEDALGLAAGPAIGSIRLAEASLLMDGTREARDRLAHAVDLVRVAGLPSQVVRALTHLADANLAIEDMDGARRAVTEAADVVTSEPVFPSVAADLDRVATIVGRTAVQSARAERLLYEDLTDRELSILRALPGPLTQREIGRELYLSVNTVKGYTKSLYRKLGVASRDEAVNRARQLELI